MRGYITIFVLSFLLVSTATAQTSDLILNWKSDVFVPAFYSGKALPTASSKVKLSVNLLRDNRLLSLGGREISWYLNNKLIKKGVGGQKADFLAEDGSNALVRVVVKIGEQEVEKIITIPVIKPELVIAPQPTNVFQALPFFFNARKISDFIFRWMVGGRETQGKVGSPDVLELGAPEGLEQAEIILSASVQNKQSPLEVGKSVLKLLIR